MGPHGRGKWANRNGSVSFWLYCWRYSNTIDINHSFGWIVYYLQLSFQQNHEQWYRSRVNLPFFLDVYVSSSEQILCESRRRPVIQIQRLCHSVGGDNQYFISRCSWLHGKFIEHCRRTSTADFFALANQMLPSSTSNASPSSAAFSIKTVENEEVRQRRPMGSVCHLFGRLRRWSETSNLALRSWFVPPSLTWSRSHGILL